MWNICNLGLTAPAPAVSVLATVLSLSLSLSPATVAQPPHKLPRRHACAINTTNKQPRKQRLHK